MPDPSPSSPNRVALDRVDWLSVAPVLRLASALRYALKPGNLVVALLAVLLLHGGGLLMDAAWGEPAKAYAPADRGIYQATLDMQTEAFYALVRSALQLELGLGGEAFGVGDALHGMFVHVPATLFDHHPWFAVVFGLIALAVLCPASGVICRMTATRVCSDRGTSMRSAVKFVARRWAWYVLTPLMPTLLVLLIGGVLITLGFVFFNLAGLEVVGSLLFGLLLLLGLAIALVTIVLVFALNLMAPALSVEGTDGFDAIARSFNYVMYRPWQFATYLVVAVAYLAVVYLLIATIAGVTLKATHAFVDIGAFATLDELTYVDQMQRYEAITAESRPFYVDGEFVQAPPSEVAESNSINASGWIVRRWYGLGLALIVAILYSVVCCLQTQVYVLLRRSMDGTPTDECAPDEESDPWSSPADMVDAEAQAIAAAGPAAASAQAQDKPATEE